MSQLVRLSVCVSVCVSVHFLSFLFKRPFDPTSRNPMSKMFRDLEYLGKSNGKMGFQICTLLFIKGVKLPRRKSFFLATFFVHPLSENALPDGLETSDRRVYR